MTDKSEKEKRSKDEVNDLDMNLDEFGTLQSNVSIDKLNTFLDENLEDKKLKGEDKKSKS